MPPSLVLAVLAFAGWGGADEQWVRARSAHVEVLSDGTPGQARRAAERLEAFHRVLQSALGGMPGLFAADAPPPLVLAFRGESYGRYVPLRNGEPQEADGFILGG